MIPGLSQWVKDLRCGSDVALLWLWCSLAAIDPIRLLAWESPYASGVALKSKKKERKRKKENISKLLPCQEENIASTLEASLLSVLSVACLPKAGTLMNFLVNSSLTFFIVLSLHVSLNTIDRFCLLKVGLQNCI